MILYNPTQGEIYMNRIPVRPNTCFLMTKLGKPIPRNVSLITKTAKKYLRIAGIKTIDANSVRTGRDFLTKIWEMIVSVPLGIAVITEELSPQTMANVFFEIGILQTMGKETLVIKSKDCEVPSDFVRTEHIEYGRGFKSDINKYLKTFFNQANHYDTLGDELDKNPLVTIDYLKRAYLITGDKRAKKKIDKGIDDFIDSTNFDDTGKKNIRDLLRL